MIFLDTNPFVIDLRYPGDPVHSENRRFLERVQEEKIGLTGVLNLLELCGILSFNLAPLRLLELFIHFPARYGIRILPAGDWDLPLPAPLVRAVLDKMKSKMSLKDAEIAIQAEEQADEITAFVTWNAKHFKDKLPFPALTPRQWMRAYRH